VEATEEAIYDALFTATAVEGAGSRVEPLPIADVRKILQRFGRVSP
jgi:D-aminopeptidase